MTVQDKIDAAIAAYIRARRRILRLGAENPQLVGGNDNIIGRIGEYHALRLLQSIGQAPRKEDVSSQKGYDFRDTVRQGLRTQVKVISVENKSGRSVRLTEPWDQLLLIVLGDDYTPVRAGLLTKAQFLAARKANAGFSPRPFAKRTMLGRKGLIGRYGRILVP